MSKYSKIRKGKQKNKKTNDKMVELIQSNIARSDKKIKTQLNAVHKKPTLNLTIKLGKKNGKRCTMQTLFKRKLEGLF